MNRLRCLAFSGLSIIAAGCSGSSSPAAPTPPPTPACQANHTADASFRNNGNSTINILLDGGNIGTLGPQQSGLTRTIAAGVAHSVVFQLTNTTRSLCAAFNPIPVECSTPVYGSCTY